MYHQIAPSAEQPADSYLHVSPEIFERQVEFFHCRRYEFITLSQAWKRIEAGVGGKPAVVFTFDDISLNFLKYALPVLNKFNATATGFAIADPQAAQRLCKPGDEMDTPLAPAQLRELAAQGIEIGSHTVSHRELTSVSNDELRHELADSKSILENALGSAVESFCYPRGRLSPRIEQAVADTGYLCAASTLRGNMHIAADRLRLKRIRATAKRTGYSLWYTTWRIYDLLNRKRTRKETALFAAADKWDSNSDKGAPGK